MCYKEAKCKICDEQFNNLKGLHHHLKVHKITVGDYYSKYYPRKSMLTGELLPFKDVKQYMESDFANNYEMKKWISSASKKEGREYLSKTFKGLFESKGGALLYNEINSIPSVPDVEDIIKFFGSYGAFVKSIGYEVPKKKKLEDEFWTNSYDDITFSIDSREKYPFKFKKSLKNVKIDIGDYCALGDDYDYTYVDRKAVGDFIGTLSVGNLDRFKRELKRAREKDCFLFIVIEGSIDFIKNKHVYSKKQAGPEYIFHNMRAVQREFIDVCQFVFCDNIQKANDMTGRILKAGKSIWDVDLQFFINKKTR